MYGILPPICNNKEVFKKTMYITQKINVLYVAVIAVLATHALFADSVGSSGVDVTPIGYMMTGVDRYKNGAPLAENEYYALVWEKEPGAFTGFRRDGSLCNVAGCEVVSLIRADRIKSCNGHVTFYIPTNLHPDGKYGVVALDTRGVDGVPVGIRPGERMPRLINGWGWANMKEDVASKADADAKKLMAAVSSGHVTDTDTELPDDCPNPVINAMGKDEQGNLVLSVANTVEYGTYATLVGDELSKIDLRSGKIVAGNGTAVEMHTDRKISGRGFAKVVIVNLSDVLEK